jgi:predicted nuclease of restriction endonuclease-like RecB superfamily
VAAAREAALKDSRIRVFAFEKGSNRGEEHRHTALQKAAGRFVCHLADERSLAAKSPA